MDYALREKGWLDEFLQKPDTSCYAVEEDGDLIGFTILAKTGGKDAEFRIALRADKTGLGLGESITCMTLQKGFKDLGLHRIHLVVRKNNGECRKGQPLTRDKTGEKAVDSQILRLLRRPAVLL